MKVKVVLLSDKPFYYFLLNNFLEKDQIFTLEKISSFADVVKVNSIKIVICDIDFFNLNNDNFFEKFDGIDFIFISHQMQNNAKVKNVTYIIKPFAISSLINNISLIQKRNNQQSHKMICSDYIFNFNKRVIKIKNETISLTEKESELIKYLYENKHFVSKKKILENVWGYTKSADTHTIETHVYKLRKKTNDFIIITNDNSYKISQSICFEEEADKSQDLQF